MTEYGWRINNKTTKGKAKTESSAERKLSDDLKRLFRIYFPTRDTVANSKGGIGVSFILHNIQGFPRFSVKDILSIQKER
jgi:hypothetical protein